MKKLLILAVASLLSAPAWAENPQLNANTWRPSPLAGSLLGTETARKAPAGTLNAGAWFSLSHLPVIVTDSESGAQVALVRRVIAADVFAAYSVLDWLAVGVTVPVFLQTAGDDLPAELKLTKVGGSSLGDVRVAARVAILDAGAGGGLSLGLGEEVGLPTATKHDFSGDAGLTTTTRVVAGYTVADLHLSLSAGLRMRKAVDVLGISFGNELVFSGAAAYAVLPGKLDAIGALSGWTGTGKPFDAASTVCDGIAGGRYHLGDLAITAGAGGGLATGFGSPAFRAVLAVAYAPLLPTDPGYAGKGSGGGKAGEAFQCPGHPEVTAEALCKDGDEDGTLDKDDACPAAKGAAATKGCPDGDGDGVADKDDRCPRHAGSPQVNGCPDGDGDLVGDDIDECVGVKGTAKAKGCPDGDDDGVADAADKCPTVAGVADNKGCPTDRDGDGIADKDDKCPDAPGTAAKGGCPEQRVTVTAKKIVLSDKVFFDSGAASIDKKSYGLLDEIASVLKKNPQVKLVRIEGHTDNAGTPEENKSLSEKRAAAVKKYLEGKGVSAKRLQSAGLGDTRPVGDNGTDEGKAANRRVEFIVVDGE